MTQQNPNSIVKPQGDLKMKMKILIPLLIFMSLLITEAVAQNTPAEAPTNLIPDVGDRTLTLSWTPPSDTGSHPIIAYQFFEEGGTLATWELVGGYTPVTSLRRSLVKNGTRTYRIRALTGDTTLFTWLLIEGKETARISITTKIPRPKGFTVTLDEPTTGDRTATLKWTAPPLRSGAPGVTYQYSQDGGTWTSAGNGTSHRVTGLTNGIQYAFRVRAIRTGEDPEKFSDISRTFSVTPLRDAPGSPGTLNVERVEDTALLTWSPPSNAEEDILRYEYSEDGGSTWQSTGSTDTTYTVTGLERGETYTFLVRAIYVDGTTSRIISPPGSSSNAAILTYPKRRVMDCPVGWVRSDGFAGRNRRVLIYEVNVEMDMQDLVSIYKPIWVAIYVHPDEGLENLAGWKLQVALPYNQHSEYLLTAENSVIVDAGFVEGGFAFIENPEENPFPMVGIGFTGSPAPGFDYRLYDETGKRVDFGISCYKRGDIFQVLKEMEDPRILRQVLLETLDWDAHYLRSEWTVPMPAPAAPSLVKKNIVGTWADLKKQ